MCYDHKAEWPNWRSRPCWILSEVKSYAKTVSSTSFIVPRLEFSAILRTADQVMTTKLIIQNGGSHHVGFCDNHCRHLNEKTTITTIMRQFMTKTYRADM